MSGFCGAKINLVALAGKNPGFAVCGANAAMHHDSQAPWLIHKFLLHFKALQRGQVCSASIFGYWLIWADNGSAVVIVSFLWLVNGRLAHFLFVRADYGLGGIAGNDIDRAGL